MGVKLVSASGGSVELNAPTTASNFALTVPANNGTVLTTASTFAGTGPAFSSYITTTGTFPHNVTTKIPFGSETFDTNSNFDTSTYRFTPTVSGYYQINLSIDLAVNQSRTYLFLLSLQKNATPIANRTLSVTNPGGGADESLGVGMVVYMNGSTDYLEGYMYHYDYTAATTITYTGGDRWANFSGTLVRAA